MRFFIDIVRYAAEDTVMVTSGCKFHFGIDWSLGNTVFQPIGNSARMIH